MNLLMKMAIDVNYNLSQLYFKFATIKTNNMACQSRIKKAFDEYNERIDDRSFIWTVEKFYSENPNLSNIGSIEQYKDYSAKVSAGILPNSIGGYINDGRDYSTLTDNEAGFSSYMTNSKESDEVMTMMRDLMDGQDNSVGNQVFGEVMEQLSKTIGKEYKIISSDEARSIIGDQFTGQKGFYFNNTAYVLDFAANLSTGIHEINHPFVDAIADQNKELFDKLVSDILATNTGAKVMDRIKSDYKDLNEHYQQRELVTRFLSEEVQNNIEYGEDNKVKSIWDRILYAIRQLVRKIFGSKTKISNLKTDTTLKELADMLTSEKHVFDTSTFTEKDVIQFLQDNKELIENLSELKHDDLVKLIDRIGERVNIDTKLKYTFSEVKNTVTAEGSRSEFEKMSSSIQHAKKTEDDLNKARDLANIIGYAQDMAESIHNKIREINREVKEPDQDTLKRLYYFNSVLTDWKQLSDEISDLIAEYDIPSESALNKAIANLSHNISDALKQSGRKELDAIANTLGTFLEDAAIQIRRDEEAALERMRKASEKNPRINKLIEARKKRFTKLDLSKENLAKYMRGEYGDANFWSGLVEAYISHPDPIISGFSSFVEYNVLGMNAQFRQFDNEMRLNLAERFKKAGIDRTNPAKLAKLILFVDKIMEYDEEGKPKEGVVYALLQQFKNYRYKRDILEYNLDEALKSKDKERILEARLEREQFHNDYMHRKYVPEYYQLQKHWQTPEGELANKARMEILDEIRMYQDDLSVDPEKQDEELAIIDSLWDKYSQLSSLTNLDGTLKVDDPANNDYSFTIAKTIREYQEKSREFYEEVPIKNLFETKYNEYRQSLVDQDFTSEEIKQKTQEWLDKNTRKVLTKEFYDNRQQILDTISRILSKLPDSVKKELEIEPIWKAIIDQSKGFRDQDGQLNGMNMTPEKIKEIKKLQEDIINAQSKYVGLSGLTEEEQSRLNQLYKIKEQNGRWNEEEFAEVKELKGRKSEMKSHITDQEFDDLFDAFQDLKELQSKIPTEYYMQIMDEWFSKMNKPLIDKFDIGEFINTEEFNTILESNEEFKKWFEANHIKRTKWVAPKEGQQYGKYEEHRERLYNWNYIIPNNQKYYESFKLSDGTIIEGKPTRQYYYRTVKKKYHTGYNPSTGKVELKVGVHITNKHTNERPDFLPRTMAEGAKDAIYINQDYARLQKENPHVFNILKVYTEALLKGQEGLSHINRIGLDYPRFAREMDEYILGGHIVDNVGTKLKELKSGVGSVFKKKSDDFQRDLGNYEDDLKERLMNYDMFGNEIVRVPQRGLSKIEPERLSMNVGESIMKYVHSAMMNKTLVDMQPMAKALMQVLEQQGVKNLKGISRNEFMKSGLRVLGKQSGNRNNRLLILRNMYETIWEGKTTHKELGSTAHKVLSQLAALTAYTSLSVNIPGAIKNNITANIQSFIESLSGEFINKKDYVQGQLLINKAIPNLLADYNKLSGHNLETQMFRAFDAIKGHMEGEIGREYANTNARYATSLGTLMMGMKTGEIQAQGAFFYGMLNHQKVTQTINGVSKEIPYHEAFELVDGKMQLKEGIDEEWAEGGKKFRRFQLKLHELSRRLQGNYAKSTQPEMMRYTLSSLVALMRRYFVPMFVNRFSFDRASPTLGKVRTGYYTVLGRIIMDTAKTHSLNWNMYTNEERGAAKKALAELGIAALLYVALRLLGWNSGDPDKYKKIQENSWAYNHLLYQIMLVKSEAEQFIPVPGLGGDELLRLANTPTIALRHLGKWYSIGGNMVSLAGYELGMVDESQVRTQQKSGIWDKGTLKVYRDAMKILGRTGATEDPITGIRNYQSFQSNPTR